MAIPKKDSLLLDWSDNANTRLTASPSTYGTTAPVAAQYATLHDAFALAYANLVAARAAGTRSRSLASIKDSAKFDLLDFARPLYKQIQANTSVTDAAKIELGVVVPHLPSPINPPTEVPVIKVMSVTNKIIKIHLRALGSDGRAKPDGCDGAFVWSYIGATPPASVQGWNLEGTTTRNTFEIGFAPTVPAGSQVWLTAAWFSPRTQPGPMCEPINTYLAGGVSAAA